MDKLEKYRCYIQNIIKEYAELSSSNDDQVEAQTIFDLKNDHYQLVYVGWSNNIRTYGCVLHLDIKDGKIWIQHDGTEIGIANKLLDLGVPHQDIVLAYQEPYVRQFTEFALG
jgi:hypothetical protein